MTTSARTTTLLSVLAGALILGLLLWSSSAPLTADQLEQLRRATDQAESQIHLARLACELQPEPADRTQCHLMVAGAEVPVKIARQVIATNEACATGSAGEACRAAQTKAAEQLLPEVRRVVEQLQRPMASASASASSAPEPPPEVPDPPAASAPVGPPRPGEGGQ
jgi:hypothetical protein